MHGLVKVRYWRELTICQKHVGLENKQWDTSSTFDVEIRVSTSLQEDIPARWRMSRIYLSRYSMIPIVVGWTSMPKK